MSEKLIIGLTGMPAAGKAFIGKRFVELGCELYTVGSTLKLYAERQNTPIRNRADAADLWHRVVRQDPMAMLQVPLAAKGDVVVDSIRVPNHARQLRAHAEIQGARFVLLGAVCDSDEVRFARAMENFDERGQRDPTDFEAFIAENQPEMYSPDPNEISLQTVLDMADYHIDTLALSKREVMEAVDNLWMLQH
ncbi:MAG: hypothetical protein JWN82_402 [Candidatus Saccharibacteria bacterium]|nr:hypothetical protein [Candidatus Saccharibacteria bacterium]